LNQSKTKKSRLRACSLEDKAHATPQGILGLPEDFRLGLLLSFTPEEESHQIYLLMIYNTRGEKHIFKIMKSSL